MNFPNYCTTVSVIDAVAFTVTKTLTVGENPQYLTADSLGNTVYLISTGDYSPGSNILQRIDTKTDIVTKIEGLNASWLSMGMGDKLYIISTEYDEFWTMTAKYYVYDAGSEKLLGEFITDGTQIPNPYHISADRVNGTGYIGSSDYVSRGDMYIFSSEGKFIHKFGVSGINPEGAYFPTSPPTPLQKRGEFSL
jgi:DNA-binding beta-propeller fold protein YncE